MTFYKTFNSPYTEGTGYEDYMPIFNKYASRTFKTDYTEQEKEAIVEEIFQIYRKENIFPLTYYNEDGVDAEIIDCMKRDVILEKEGTYLRNKYNNGLALCKALFPSLQKTERIDCESIADRFMDDKKLKIAIKLALEINFGCTPNCVFNALTLVGSTATNFKPMSAKAIYEWFTPKDGVIYDSSCGFGGRMLGALSSHKNFSYIGCEPNTETFESLNVFGKSIERVSGTNGRFKVFCIGSELFNVGKSEFVDFSFTSPPYFNLELYSKEKTQCYNKFNTLIPWIEGFVRPTIRNTFNVLKPGTFYCVNIADFNDNGKRVKYVEHWRRIAEQEGFIYLYKIKMPVTSRIGSGHTGTAPSRDEGKTEGVYVFCKPHKDGSIPNLPNGTKPKDWKLKDSAGRVVE